jgi:hypothetical protein
MQLNLNHAVFSAAIVNSTRSAMAKRGVTGGVEVNLAEIPVQTLENLLHGAITDYLQVGLKSLDKDKASTEECQAAMKARLDILKSGGVTKAADRKPGAKNTIREAAKRIVKQSFKDMSEEKLDAKQLNAYVSDIFKVHTKWLKEKDEAVKAELESAAQIVERALTTAKKQAEDQAKSTESLKDIFKAAQARIAAAEAAKADAPAKPTKAKLTPTQKVSAEKAASKGKPKTV